MKVDTSRLIGKMYERGFNKSSFADELNISRETLRNYLKKPHTIPYSVIERAITILDISSDEAKDIFFAQ